MKMIFSLTLTKVAKLEYLALQFKNCFMINQRLLSLKKVTLFWWNLPS